ncbi:hypothetical protein FNF27_00284 [Cafeteria roenbergensis]|uniref:Uncharacterized protein n=1 Tax=Cafeteria roenbergensis TaxID=33653 RepID=A0A5A8EKM3_CAFRO|nr:hypothetical protein FNF27_00284 [Cafeteria roenbergensis]
MRRMRSAVTLALSRRSAVRPAGLLPARCASSSAGPTKLSNIPGSGDAPGGAFARPIASPESGSAEHKAAATAAEGSPADELLARYIRMGRDVVARQSGIESAAELDLEALALDGHRFNAEFSADPTAPTPFVAFAKHYYAMPRPECLIPAFVSLIGQQQGLAGESQVAEALFLGRALGQLGEMATPLGALMMSIADEVGQLLMQRASSDEERMEAMRLQSVRREAMLLVMLHSEVPQLVAAVEQAAEQAEKAVRMLREGEVRPEGEGLEAGDAAAATAMAEETARRMRAILPTDPAARMPMQPLTWPLPGLPYEEPTFFEGAVGTDSPPWARSSQLVSVALTARDRGGEDGSGLDAETWARLSLAVGEACQDAMWAEVQANGDVMTLRKLLGAAAEWIAFADEHGPEHLLDTDNTPVPARYRFGEQGAQPAGGAPDADADEPADVRERVRFQLARRAMARLIREASQHPLVVEVAELERRDILHLIHSSAAGAGAGPRSTVSAAARQAGTAIESVRPLLHMALAEGRAAARPYAEHFAARLAQAMPASEQEEGAAQEPLLGRGVGVMPPGGLVAMAWALPPMVAAQWSGEDALPPELKPQGGATDEQVAAAVASAGQTGRTGFLARLLPPKPGVELDAESADALAAATAPANTGTVPIDWALAGRRASTVALDAKLAHRLFEITRRAREAELQGARPPPQGAPLPPGARPTRA